MHSFSTSKLAETLRVLSPEEFKSLGQWLKSPWCNSNKTLLAFYKKIKGYHPAFDAPNCNKERLFKQLYPKKEFKAKVILTLMSELNKQAEQLLIQLQLKGDDHIRGKLLEDAFLLRSGMERYGLMVDQRMERLEAQKVLTQKDKLELFFYYEGMYRQANPNIRQQPMQTVLYKMNHYLDRFYALEKHRMQNEITERVAVMKNEEPIAIDAQTLTVLREELNEPVLDLYVLKETGGQGGKANYLLFKNRFKEQVDSLIFKDQKMLFFTLINMGMRLDFQGEDAMVEELFELYEMGLEKGWLIHKGQITERTFANIIAVSNILRKSVFAKVFIEEYIAYLERDIQEDAKTWGLAHTDYYLGDYELVVERLRGYTFKVHVYNFQGRFLLLKAYFDLYREDASYYDYFHSYMLAIEKFFRRDKLFSNQRMKSCLKFLKFLKKLTVHISKDSLRLESLSDLKKEILADDNLLSRKWLLNKLEEISN